MAQVYNRDDLVPKQIKFGISETVLAWVIAPFFAIFVFIFEIMSLYYEDKQ